MSSTKAENREICLSIKSSSVITRIVATITTRIVATITTRIAGLQRAASEWPMSARKSTRCHYNPITRVDSSPWLNYSPHVNNVGSSIVDAVSYYHRDFLAISKTDWESFSKP